MGKRAIGHVPVNRYILYLSLCHVYSISKNNFHEGFCNLKILKWTIEFKQHDICIDYLILQYFVYNCFIFVLHVFFYPIVIQQTADEDTTLAITESGKEDNSSTNTHQIKVMLTFCWFIRLFLIGFFSDLLVMDWEYVQ